jgi:glycolate oxidase iron-sulfur subunit
LQHGQRCADFPGQLLEQAGYELVAVTDAGMCCGSAGTYSILQPDLAEELGTRKVLALTANEPEVIATANVGCQVHIGGLAETPVMHWLELLVPQRDREE